jgi:threonylcarbamoyladenosine tRNA methylthiotransferase MtaB
MADEPRIARHVHMPLQSGSDSVLKRMCRKYRTRHYMSRLELAARLVPDVAIGADVMTGFPGETDEEFSETAAFVEAQPFTYLHVFTYSERPGTAAAEATGAVPANIRRERTHILRALGERKNLQFRQALAGKTVRAVTLQRCGFALTTNFIEVELRQPRSANQMIEVAISGITQNGVEEKTLD